MIVRSAATFTSDLPNDYLESEDGNSVINYGGGNVIQAVGEILERLGCVVDPPDYAHEHGWELGATCGKQRIWCQVTLIEAYLLQFRDPTINFFRRKRPIYLDVLRRFAQELGKDRRFHNVLWFREEDLFSKVPGSVESVTDD